MLPVRTLIGELVSNKGEREILELSTMHEETDTKVFTCINYVNQPLTGCDSTSFIYGIGREKAYNIFEQNEVCTDAFPLLDECEVVPPNVIDLLEQFVRRISMKSDTKDSSVEPKRKLTLKHFRQQKVIFFYT